MKKFLTWVFLILFSFYGFADRNKLVENKKKCLSGDQFYCEPIRNKKELTSSKSLCKKGNIPSCLLVALYYEKKKDYVTASLFADKSCKLKSGIGCITLAEYKSGFAGVEKDENLYKKLMFMGVDFLNEECNKGVKSSCYLLISLFQEKENEIYTRQYNPPLKIMYDTCYDDNYDINFGACYSLAGYVDKHPDKIKKKYAPKVLFSRYVELKIKRCETKKDFTKCLDVAKNIYEKKFGYENSDEAEILFKKACEQENQAACNYVGIINVEKKNYKISRKFYKKACDLKAGYACSNLGGLYKNGYGGLVDYEAAFEAYKKGGALGDTDSLHYAGLLYKKLIEADTNNLGMGVSMYLNTGEIDYCVEAYMCFNVAAALGNEESKKELEKLKSRINAGQIMEAQKRSKLWMEKYKQNNNDKS